MFVFFVFFPSDRLQFIIQWWDSGAVFAGQYGGRGWTIAFLNSRGTWSRCASVWGRNASGHDPAVLFTHTHTRAHTHINPVTLSSWLQYKLSSNLWLALFCGYLVGLLPNCGTFIRPAGSCACALIIVNDCQNVGAVNLRAHFSLFESLEQQQQTAPKKILSCRLEQRHDKWQIKMFTCRTIVGIPPDNVTISIFSGSLKRWQEKPGSVFTTLDGVRENKHSLTRSTITVENVRKHQLQPITPPTCNIAALADKGSCCKLVQDKVTTTANECLPVSGLSTIGTALVSASLVLFRVIMSYCWTLIRSWLECYHYICMCVHTVAEM